MFAAQSIQRLIAIGCWICVQHFALLGPVKGENDKPPVIIIHGILGSKLYIKGENVQYPPNKGLEVCEKNFPWRKVWFDIPKLTEHTDCYIHQMKLYYNRSSERYENLPGIEISTFNPRDMKWGDAGSLICIASDTIYPQPKWSFGLETGADRKTVVQREFDIAACQMNRFFKGFLSDVYAVKLMEYLIKTFQILPHDGLFIAPYDWRHNYNSYALDPYYADLTEVVEKARKKFNKKVTFIAHSMGNLVLSHFMQMKSKAWLEQNVHAQINIAPPYGGTTLMMSALKDTFNALALSGFFRAVQNFFVPDYYLKYFFRSTPSAAVLLPREHSFGRRELFRDLDSQRNFGADEMVQFLQYLELPEMVKIYEETNEMKLPPAPSIDIHCIYSKTFEKKTPTVHVYSGSGKTFKNFGNGDERVNIESMVNPCKWFADERAKLGLYNVKNYSIDGPDHLEILGHMETLSIIEKLLSNLTGVISPRVSRKEVEFRSGEDLVELARSDAAEYDVKKAPVMTVELFDFFKDLPQYRVQKREKGPSKSNDPLDIWEAKTDPTHVWTINLAYGDSAWDRTPYKNAKLELETNEEEQEFAVDKMLEIVRMEEMARMESAEGGYNELVLMEQPWELAVPYAMETDERKLHLSGKDQWAGVDLAEEKELIALMGGKHERYKNDMTGMLEDMRAQMGLTIKLIPLGVLIEGLKKDEASAKIKFLILGVKETREKIGDKNILQIIKKCDHILLEFEDPKLNRHSIRIDQAPSRDVNNLAKYISAEMNLTSVDFAISKQNWLFKIGQNPKANFGTVVEEFIEMIRSKWGVKVDSRLEGGKADDFALIREELTDWKISLKLHEDFGETMMQNRLKWQKKHRFVRFKHSLINMMEQLAVELEEKAKNFLKAGFVNMFPLATTGSDSIFFLVLSVAKDIENGILRVDNLKKDLIKETVIADE